MGPTLVIHDNFGSWLANVWELSLAMQNGEQLIKQFMVFRNNRSEWQCCQTSKFYLHRIKKTEVDPRTLPQLRWSSMWQSYLICFWKGTKDFNRHTWHSKKLRGIQFLDPNSLSWNTVGMASIFSFFQLLYIDFIMHPYFTWLL